MGKGKHSRACRSAQSRARWGAVLSVLTAAAACGDVAGDAIVLATNIVQRAGAGGGSAQPQAGAGGATAVDTSGGLGGTESTGGASAGSAAVTTGGSTSTDICRLALPGATGNEPDGLIPVCCSLTAAEQALADEAFGLLNDYRVANGLQALVRTSGLEETIQGHCIHMATHSFFDDNAPEAAVSELWTRADLCGTSASGEMIAWGQDTAAEVVQRWIDDPDTNAFILNTRWAAAAVGVHQTYWGVLFAN